MDTELQKIFEDADTFSFQADDVAESAINEISGEDSNCSSSEDENTKIVGHDGGKASGSGTFTDFERLVLSQLKELNRKVESVMMNQAKLNLHLLPGERVISRPPGMPTIPVKSLSELDKLEKYLENSESVTNLSILLSTFISKSEAEEYKSTMRLLPQVMDNSVAKHFSMAGKKGKKAFNALKAWTAVKGAVVCKIDSTDLTETEKATKAWLRDAPFRNQGDGSTSRRSKSR